MPQSQTAPESEKPTNGRRPLAAALTLVAGAFTALFRVIPHPANFTSVGALGLFGGARMRVWHACAVPLVVMAVSDLALWSVSGFDPQYSLLHISRSYVYASLLVYVLIGRMIANSRSVLVIAGASLLGSLQFFLVTNLFDWLFQPLIWAEIAEPFRYSRDLGGLLNCYLAGLPFFKADYSFNILHLFTIGDMRLGFYCTVVGDLLFTGVLFGLHGLLSPAKAPAERIELEPAAR
jgi:hypothetical protein